jgi:hypothetical protein
MGRVGVDEREDREETTAGGRHWSQVSLPLRGEGRRAMERGAEGPKRGAGIGNSIPLPLRGEG